jgi:hypothetical protein
LSTPQRLSEAEAIK